MRCQCCNRALNDFESTLKSANTGQYLDTCNKCLKELGIKTVGRSDLEVFEDAYDEDDGVNDETDGEEE